MPKQERMSPVDTTWLRMDSATNLMVIVGIILLDGPVDYDRLEKTLLDRLLVFPRFKQKVDQRLTGVWWVDDPHFDKSRHIKRIRLPGDGGKEELESFVAGLCSSQLDSNHPLWQFHIIEDFKGGAALVSRIHHAIGDGMALVAVMMSMTEMSPNAKSKKKKPVVEDESPDERHGPFGLFTSGVQLANEGIRMSTDLWKAYLAAVADPAKAIQQGSGFAQEIGKILLMPNDSQTRMKGKLTGLKRVAWCDPLPLAEIKAVGKALGCSVNDVLMGGLAGALNGYLKAKGDSTTGIEIRGMVPVNLRPEGTETELGNKFGLVALELPVGMPTAPERIFEVHRRMTALKTSYQPHVSLALLQALGYAPKLLQDKFLDAISSRATAVMTNVPGPPVPLYLAGSEMKQIIFWVPQNGDIGIGVSILSYNGTVQFGLIADSAVLPDPEFLIEKVVEELEQIVYFMLLHNSPAEFAEAHPKLVKFDAKDNSISLAEPEPVPETAVAAVPA